MSTIQTILGWFISYNSKERKVWACLPGPLATAWRMPHSRLFVQHDVQHADSSSLIPMFSVDFILFEVVISFPM